MRILSGFVLAASLAAQFPGLSLPPSGDNQRCSVTQYIGPVRVTIDYNSPKVHGPGGEDRRGKIWGTLVPYGMTDLGFGNGKPGPWRAGANENTVFEVSHPVKVGGQPLAAGRYGFHVMAGPDEWTLIFSKNSTSWGSFFYEESEDALRVKAKPRKHEYREWLTFEFTERKPSRATAELQWEDLAVAWSIEVENADEIYFSRLREELRTTPGLHWQGLVEATRFAVQTGKHLDEALEWSEIAISRRYVGEENFVTLSAKAQVLAKLGRTSDAKDLLAKALRHPSATRFQIHGVGRQLLTDGKTKEAMEVFRLNAERNGDSWPVHVGLARGYAAMGDKAKALEHARKALPQAPDRLNRENMERMVKELSGGAGV